MTVCPFCGRDPFHRSEMGEALAVDCCELGDLYFRGARPPVTEDVVVDADTFREIGGRIVDMQQELAAFRDRYGEIWDEPRQT